MGSTISHHPGWWIWQEYNRHCSPPPANDPGLQMKKRNTPITIACISQLFPEFFQQVAAGQSSSLKNASTTTGSNCFADCSWIYVNASSNRQARRYGRSVNQCVPRHLRPQKYAQLMVFLPPSNPHYSLYRPHHS